MSFKNLVLSILGVNLEEYNEEIKDLEEKLSEAESEIKELQKKYNLSVDENGKLNKTILEKNTKIEFLNNQINELTTNELENTLNNKYPKINKVYLRYETDNTYYIDVRNFFQPYDANLPTITGNNSDEIAYNSLMWVLDNMTYLSDDKEYNQVEYWAYPYQSLKNKKGDCEDGSILLANILLHNGVPYYRIRLCAGSVNGGGHCYLTYCRETDNKFIVLDWCYWPNNKAIKDRPTHEEERNYMDQEKNFYVWFSWNMKYIFGELQAPNTLIGNNILTK